jgi:hypothetical protein
MTMPKQWIAILMVSIPSFTISAQEIVLGGGHMSIAPGTTMRLEGPLTLKLEPGSSVQNDGHIDLGNEATVDEPTNGPIHGDGYETAHVTTVAPFAAIEPGGLGLTLGTSGSNAPDRIERWHTPLVLPEGDQSIARRFVLLGNEQGPGTLDVDLHMDPTELNALDAGNLAMFHASDVNGPWNELTSIADAGSFTVSTTYPAPWGTITCFDTDAPTAVDDRAEAYGFRAWPTLVETSMTIVPLTSTPVRNVEVFDGAGRTIPVNATLNGMWANIGLEHLASGHYLLRVNGNVVIKFRKA